MIDIVHIGGNIGTDNKKKPKKKIVIQRKKNYIDSLIAVLVKSDQIKRTVVITRV